MDPEMCEYADSGTGDQAMNLAVQTRSRMEMLPDIMFWLALKQSFLQKLQS
jgi:hypothetical protein